MRALVLAAALVPLAACQQDRAPDAPPTPTATAPTPTPTTTATSPAKAVHHAIVDADGLAIGRNPGTAQYFAFDAPRAQVDAAADKWLGEADRRGSNGECGAGPMEFSHYGKLTLNYLDGKLAGWFLEVEPQAVTSDGIKPGVLMRDLKVTRSVTMADDSTLDGEFEYLAADGKAIGGFAAGEGREARIESLYAGVNCFFR